MRINCYNATETTISALEYGDTFYLDGTLYIKVAPNDVDLITTQQCRSFIVDLARGVLRSIKSDTNVLLADTTVVANG